VEDFVYFKMQKRILFFFHFLILTAALPAQDCHTFQEFSSGGGSMAELDARFPPAMAVNPDDAVFGGREDEFFNAWTTLLSDFAAQLSGAGYQWGKKTGCFCRVYFNSDGTIHTFLYNFKNGSVDPEKEKFFHRELTSFIQDYALKVDQPAPSAFSQCGPVTFSDKE
jgi:hypothetical protein